MSWEKKYKEWNEKHHTPRTAFRAGWEARGTDEDVARRMIDKFTDNTDHQELYHNTGWTGLGMMKEWLDREDA